MVQVTYTDKRSFSISIPSELTEGKRRLTKEEIEILEKNQNTSDDPSWQNFYVDALRPLSYAIRRFPVLPFWESSGAQCLSTTISNSKKVSTIPN